MLPFFIDATKCFGGFHSKIYHDTNIWRSFNKIRGIVLLEQLIFLQRIVAKINVTRGCQFWRKEVVLRIFAKWCKQNSNEIKLAPWQCLTNDMTLFDVVYLDTVHGFDVPNEVLLEYVDKGWSTGFVCRLANVYYNEFDQGVSTTQIKYSILFKTFLMMQYAVDRDYPTAAAITSCIHTLIKHKEFKLAIRVLETGACEMLMSNESNFIDDLDSVVGYKTKNEFHEMNDLIQGGSFDIRRFRMSVQVFFLYSSYVCYKNLGHGEKIRSVLDLFLHVYTNYLSGSYSGYFHILLLLEVFEHLSKTSKSSTRNRKSEILYNVNMAIKMSMIKVVADRYEKCDSEENEPIYPNTRFICSCGISGLLQAELDSLPQGPVQNESDYILPEVIIERHTKSTADRLYYAQFLVFNKHVEKAITILNSIVESEGDYSLSVFICPKPFWESNFLDDNLRRELSKSSADYVVFPTNLYARYLLANAYNSLGQMEQCERNKTEFRILRQRYSSVEAFASMLNIVSNFFN